MSIGHAEQRVRSSLARCPEGLTTSELSALTGAGSKARCERTVMAMRDVYVDRWIDNSTPVWMLADITPDCPRPDGSRLER